jgi:hypothetical protein
VLLALPGGCSHDLSLLDTTVAAGTRVGDACVHECGGHASCAPTALDLGFLGAASDTSGTKVEVTTIGDACVDSGGVTFSGSGHVEVGLGGDYAADATFTLSFWLLKAEANAWDARYADDGLDTASSETIFIHPVPSGQGHLGIEVSLLRGSWLDAWVLMISSSMGGVSQVASS